MGNDFDREKSVQSVIGRFQRFIAALSTMFILSGVVYGLAYQIKSSLDTQILQIYAEMNTVMDSIGKELALGDREGAELVIRYMAEKYVPPHGSVALILGEKDIGACLFGIYYLNQAKVCWRLADMAVDVRWPILGHDLNFGIAMRIPISAVIPSFFNYPFVTLVAMLAILYLATREFLHKIQRHLVAPLADFHQSLERGDLSFKSDSPLLEIRALEDAAKALRERECERRQLLKFEAVAKTTQMVAHDVRKPFSILRMGMRMLASAQDPESVKKILGRLVPEIEKAVGSVEGLLADVMEIGSSSTQFVREPANPEFLIESTLSDMATLYPMGKISVSYDLKHRRLVLVNIQKVGRVFSNIVANAVQAAHYHGELWFKTRECDGFIEFCIGNSHSYIPPENIDRLFEAFFTASKKSGTGLGLAIALKVVSAHGGKIWCESSKCAAYPEGKTEFFFTLPVVDGAWLRAATPPREASDYHI
jgi:signal transduction histidine kinase